jgi:hypothetical protein
MTDTEIRRDFGPLPVVHSRANNLERAHNAMFGVWCDNCAEYKLTFAEQFDVLTRILRFLAGQCVQGERRQSK